MARTGSVKEEDVQPGSQKVTVPPYGVVGMSPRAEDFEYRSKQDRI